MIIDTRLKIITLFFSVTMSAACTQIPIVYDRSNKEDTKQTTIDRDGAIAYNNRGIAKAELENNEAAIKD